MGFGRPLLSGTIARAIGGVSSGSTCLAGIHSRAPQCLRILGSREFERLETTGRHFSGCSGGGSIRSLPSSISVYSSNISKSRISTSRISTNRKTQLLNQSLLSKSLHYACQQHRSALLDREMLDVSVTGGYSSTGEREILPQNVKPLNYNLTLEPDFEKFTFEGTVAILLDVFETSNEISLNSIEIEIHSTSLKIEDSGASKDIAPSSTEFNEDNQTVKFSFPESFKAGKKVVLTIKFTGLLNDKMAGFYRSSYTAQDGSTKYMATTQMEPTDCRRAFPCFDEPALKATYDITLIADKSLTCLSNMNVIDEKSLESGKKAVSFATTPLMSTYLLAFIVAELKYVETTWFRIPVRVYATPGNEVNGHFSCELAAKTIKFFEETFDIPYPLPKMDMVAIPDFSAGAMENWGLITYRVVDLLFDENTSGAATKQRVAEVVQHELAHQWFGNLVTMDWWEGLWLNEGFATWMSWFSCNEFYPDWKVWESYVTDNLQAALRLDGLRSSHPIEVPVKRADEINQIFDAISYSKGSCVLRMVSKFLGEDVFIAGIQTYLKRHKYSNTQTGDLWAALSEVSGKDVSALMDSWTKRVGYPVLTVSEAADGKSITVRQNRFLSSGDVKPDEDETLYPVSLGLRTKAGVNEDLMLTTRETTIPIDDKFFKINADHSGIYRTAYSADRLAQLGKDAQSGLLSVEDRAGLVADTGALAASGYASTDGLLSLVSGWKNEKDFVVWDEIIARIGAIRSAWLFEDEDVKAALKKFQRELVSPKANALGWTFDANVGHVEQQFKSLMFSSAGTAGDEAVIAAAKVLFASFAAGNKSAIHPNIKAAVFSIALQNGGDAEWDVIHRTYLNPINKDEENTALRALGRTKSPKLIQKTLDMILDGKSIRAQDVYLPMGGLRTTVEGTRALWSWLELHWDEVEKLLPPGLSMLSSVVSLATGGFCKQEDVDTVEAFFAKRNTKGYDKGLAQSLESVRSKIQWVERDGEVVKKWLKSNGYFN
ncbi:peptidase family M1-domain-containing protein [Lipomyces oligophaga]|uniref:peptidase family M1-domain-containing protein n=1 Tax=Lipomyces oligophaga TaxID=45792 RepID=UPI0034CD9B5E